MAYMLNYQDLLSNLLAVIHADGGHYEAEHGTVKAVTDAIEKVFEMKATRDPSRDKQEPLSPASVP